MLRRNMTRSRRRRLVRILGGVVGVAVLVVAAVGIYLYSLESSFDSGRHVVAQAFPSARPPASSGRAAGAVNVLLIGVDENSSQAKKAGLHSTRAADMVAVVHIPASRHRVYLMSILRNSAVSLPGVGRGPISAALARGGTPLEVEAVEKLVGVRMDHVATISIPGLKGLTDALGGVTVRNTSAFANEGYSFPAGKQKLDGSRAVAFVQRGGVTAVDDKTRAQAQEAYLRGALNGFLSAGTLLNPAALSTVVSVMSPYLTVDEGLNGAYLGNLGLGLRDVRSSDVVVFRLPTAGIGRAGSADVLEVDHDRLAELQRHFRADTLDTYVR
jgi:polyisoprenyl-teichoic acid--peptidoglycan teichoic acid transferase